LHLAAEVPISDSRRDYLPSPVPFLRAAEHARRSTDRKPVSRRQL